MSQSESKRSTPTFAPLNDTNYATWSMRMEAVLVRKGLWGVVQVPLNTEGKDAKAVKAEWDEALMKRDAQKMAKARAEMILRVDDGQLFHMRSSDPMQIWQDLEHIHCARGFATTLVLWRTFLTEKKKPTQSMQAWISDVQQQVLRIEDSGFQVSKGDKIIALTMGLLESYGHLLILFDSMLPTELSWDIVITHLLNEETRQLSMARPAKGRSQAMPDWDIIDGAKALAVTGWIQASAGPELECYFCHQKGHYRSDCPELRDWMKWKKKQASYTGAIEEVMDDFDFML